MAANTDTKLLLHCNGSDGSSSFPDASPSNHTVTRVNQAEVDTAQKKWGTGSLLLDGDDDFLQIADSPDWDISTNFTIDLWQKVDNWDISHTYGYINQFVDSNNYWGMRLNATDKWIFFAVRDGPSHIVQMVTANDVIPNLNWHHVAMCKVGNEWGIYIGGIQKAHTSDSDMQTYAAPLYIGQWYSQGFEGWLDEIRIVKANPFGASPNAGLNDTITVPTGPHISWPHKASGILHPAKVLGVDANTIAKISGL